jgi:hypothetical protein
MLIPTYMVTVVGLLKHSIRPDPGGPWLADIHSTPACDAVCLLRTPRPPHAGGLPGVGPAAASVSNSLAPLLASAAGATSGLRGAVQRLGVRGLDLGVGCGVGLGYGFGAGLMLRPSALDALQQQGQRLLGEGPSQLGASCWFVSGHHRLLHPPRCDHSHITHT